MTVCPKCGFDLAAPALQRVHLIPSGADSKSYPEHVNGYYSDLEQLREQGYVDRLSSGWYVPTNKFPQ